MRISPQEGFSDSSCNALPVVLNPLLQKFLRELFASLSMSTAGMLEVHAVRLYDDSGIGPLG